MITGNEPASPCNSPFHPGLTILQHTTIEMAKAMVSGALVSKEMIDATNAIAHARGLSTEDYLAECALRQAQAIIKIL